MRDRHVPIAPSAPRTTPATPDGGSQGNGRHRAITLLVSWALSLNQALDECAREFAGLSHPQAEILIHVARAEPATLRMSELAELAVISRSGLTYSVEQLELRGLVARAPSVTDGRVVLVGLTAAGRQLARTLEPELDAVLDARFYARLPPAQVTQLEASLDLLQARP